MISPEEFKVLSKYEDVFKAWSQGRSVQVTRALYQEVEPIVKKHTNMSFTITCSACNNKLIRHAWHLFNEYIDNQAKPKSKSKK